MGNWITATGEVEASTSNLVSPDSPAPQGQNSLGQTGGNEGDGGDGRRRSTSAGYTMRPNDDASGGLMETVRTPSGSPIVGRSPRSSDVILVEGMPVDLNVAALLGYVSRNPDGSFSDKGAPSELKDPSAEAQPKDSPRGETQDKGNDDDDQGVSFGSEADETMAELISGQNPGDLFKAVDSVLHQGDVDRSTIERMASRAGVEPSQMEAQVSAVWQGAYDAASDFMAEAGIENGDAFEAFINSDSRLKSNMMEAARNYFVHHKTEGLQTMAEAYLPQMDRYESDRVKDMLSEAGYQFADKPGGGLTVLIGGAQVSWEVAVKQQIITFSRS